MGYEPVASSEVLWDGPLFGDEIGWDKGLTPTLREQYELQSRRVVPAKSAMTGVVTIYFRPEHREWALVRYADRYRWIFLTLLGQGMSGEQRLLENGFSPDEIGFLYDIVPLPDESVSPAVYDILWRAAPFPAHIHVAGAIDGRQSFTPQEIIDAATEIDPEDAFVFERFVRCHLIERKGAGTHPNARANGPGNAISVELDATYQLTSEGEAAIPQILAEYERIFVEEAFEPLYINPDHDPESHLPAEAAPGNSQDAVAEPSGEPDATGVLEELEAEFTTVAEDSGPASTTSTATESDAPARPHTHNEEPHSPAGGDEGSDDASPSSQE